MGTNQSLHDNLKKGERKVGRFDFVVVIKRLMYTLDLDLRDLPHEMSSLTPLGISFRFEFICLTLLESQSILSLSD